MFLELYMRKEIFLLLVILLVCGNVSLYSMHQESAQYARDVEYFEEKAENCQREAKIRRKKYEKQKKLEENYNIFYLHPGDKLEIDQDLYVRYFWRKTFIQNKGSETKSVRVKKMGWFFNGNLCARTMLDVLLGFVMGGLLFGAFCR